MTKQDMYQIYQRNIEELTAQNPHAEDPRLLQANQGSNCALRYTVFCRCARELGEDNPRCKYQYYRAQIACTAEQLDEWNEHRSRGKMVITIIRYWPDFVLPSMAFTCIMQGFIPMGSSLLNGQTPA